MSEWISVRDRLPKIGQRCIWYLTCESLGFLPGEKYHDYSLDHFGWKGNLITHPDKYITFTYTHWIPLPEPPKGK